MARRIELWVDRSNFRNTKVVEDETPALREGEILVAIDKFGLTSNNVSYALSGDAIGYWQFYPAPDKWGKVPVWGCGDIVESRCDEIPVGERLWGFFPMASHAVLKPGKIAPDHFRDVAKHRAELPGPSLYSSYRRTQAEPDFVQRFENERCLLFPLFATSFVLYDYLIDNDFFGAKQVIIGSVSSKTGFGLAMMLHDDPEVKQKVVGITSPGNREFVERLGCCDEIVLYGDESTIDNNLPAAYIDMSGDKSLTRALHHHLGGNMVESAMVGASHWDAGGEVGELPGATPTFFFAPTQIAKRDKEWGPGTAMVKAMEAAFAVSDKVKNTMSVEWIHGAQALNQQWQALLNNEVPGSKGLMASLLERA